jgi:hypothetical protein
MSYIILIGCWFHIIVLKVQAPIEDNIDDVKDSLYEKFECILDEFHKYHTKMLLNFNAKVGREDIFKPRVWNGSLLKTNNDNGVRVVNFATSETLIVKNTMFPHCNINKYICMPPCWESHDLIDHILIDRRRHSSILDV